MNIIKSLSSIWNREFDKGVSPYQFCLILTMIIAAIQNKEFLVYFSMFHILLGYFEVTDLRFSIKRGKNGR